MFARRIECFPKINLYLRVVRRRPDGYHELETLFQSIGEGDCLTVRPSSDGVVTLATDDPDLPTDDRNLVVRAARLLRERFGPLTDPGARLDLVKRVPSGAGLGGGSSDAAAALRLLTEWWRLPTSREDLHSLAAELGSDVPFFLYGGTCVGRGRGERLEPVETPRLWLVLARPPVAVATPWAFRQWRPGVSTGAGLDSFLRALGSGDPAEVGALLRNDLEAGVEAGVPEIARLRGWLLEQGVYGARMTGSGSVVFGIARDEAHARQVALKPGAPGKVWASPMLTAAEACAPPRPVAAG
jgi:4-diphosphocytidyl-2-C-methyl-D-erythritol kinase